MKDEKASCSSFILPPSSFLGGVMLDGADVVAALEGCGVTHVVWVPDSVLGRWEAALAGARGLRLVRVCRVAEGLAVAGGLLLGGARPVAVMQCTGLFDAGDALRNLVYDLRLPLFLVVGVRNLLAHRKGTTADNCPVFTEPILQAWRIPFTVLEEGSGAAGLADAYRRARQKNEAAAVLLPE
jgi:sulfopyruvate decarboxylase TPP-binding subunit